MNKEEEQIILNKVYKEDTIYIITESEKPDFIINNKETNETFGVEVTKLYYNPSSARLKEIPDYTYKLLKSGIPRRDQGVLNPHSIYVCINDKWEYLGDTIGQKFKTYDDYILTLTETIKSKSEKAKKYRQLDYLELFIEDKETYLFFKDLSELEYLKSSKELMKAINNSPFKRIYLFTIIDKQEVLLLLGDITTGPLKVSEEDMIIHQKYMKEIYNNRKKSENKEKG